MRHGQSSNNLLLAQQGHLEGRFPDPPLTDLGFLQSERLAGAMRGWVAPWRVTHVYTSLMTRAVQTAAALGKALGLPVQGHPLLAECGGPYVTRAGARLATRGTGRRDLAVLAPGLVLPAEVGTDGWWSREYEAEEDVWEARAQEVLTGLREEHADTDVVGLVTHEGFSQRLVRRLLGIETMTGWFGLYNTGVVRVWDETGHLTGTSTVEHCNDVRHLADCEITD